MCRTASMRRPARRRSIEPGEYRIASSAAPASGESSWRSCAAPRTSSTRAGARRCGPASGRLPAPTPRRRTPTSSTRVVGRFDRWSEARRDERLGVSAQYLPEEVRPYASSLRPRTDLGDTNRRTATCGIRRSPRTGARITTAAGRRCGRTAGPGSAPTPGPGRRTTTGAGDSPPASGSGFRDAAGRPAWVSWAYAPGYVSWCPLGWNNRPVLQIVNFNRYGRGYDPWRAWTVGASPSLRPRLREHPLRRRRTFDARTRSSFVPRSSRPTSADTPCRARRHRSASPAPVHHGARARRSTPIWSPVRRASVATDSASSSENPAAQSARARQAGSIALPRRCVDRRPRATVQSRSGVTPRPPLLHQQCRVKRRDDGPCRVRNRRRRLPLRPGYLPIEPGARDSRAAARKRACTALSRLAVRAPRAGAVRAGRYAAPGIPAVWQRGTSSI